jgi:hypothetical protein
MEGGSPGSLCPTSASSFALAASLTFFSSRLSSSDGSTDVSDATEDTAVSFSFPFPFPLAWTFSLSCFSSSSFSSCACFHSTSSSSMDRRIVSRFSGSSLERQSSSFCLLLPRLLAVWQQ